MTMTKIVDGVTVELSPAEEAEIQAEWDAFLAAPTPVPQMVRKLALVRACRQTPWGESDLWTHAKAALAAADPEVQEDWELAVEIERANADFIALCTALGATSQQIDDVFILAATLE